MANGNRGSKLRLWCSAFACTLLALVETDGLFVDITYVESAVAKGAGQSHTPILCLFYLRPTDSSFALFTPLLIM
jgi:hypothetical protein